jgi:putative ABC transport system permease protein
MRPLWFAWRSLTRQPARAVLGIVGIAAVGALLFDMLLLSRGLVLSFGDLLESVGFDVRITATEALPSSGPPIESVSQVVRTVEALPEIDAAVPIAFGRAAVPGVMSLDLIGSGPTERNVWKVLDGEALPSQEEEGAAPALVVNGNVAELLELAPGDELTLMAIGSEATALPKVVFVVVGVADFYFDTPDARTAAVLLPAYWRAYGETRRDEADMLLLRSSADTRPESAVATIREVYPDLNVFSNEQFLARFQRTEFSYFRQISFALSTVTLFFAFLLVTTLLTVSVNQRFAEIASLRALGFARRRIVADLLWESALMVGTGGLIALPVGGLLASRLDAILKAMPGLPERLHFFVMEPRSALLYVALLTGTGILAALYPVYLAARLPIAATLRKETVS